MVETLATHAKEESTYVVVATFKDEDGALVTPQTITWTLTDLHGTIINNRKDVAVASPASAVNIVLSGSDLSTQRASSAERLLAIEATYDSDLGNGLPLCSEVKFIIDGIVGIE
jgi:hypothetical protein